MKEKLSEYERIERDIERAEKYGPPICIFLAVLLHIAAVVTFVE